MESDSAPAGGRLRLVTPEDAPAILGIYAPVVEQTAISFELAAPDLEEVRRRISEGLVRYPWLVCDAPGGPAGYAYASQHRARLAYQWAAEVSVYVHPERRGQGVGRRLYRALLALLALQGYCVAYAGIALPNQASVALHEAVGFRPLVVYRAVGYKHGAWRDVGWWECDLRPREPDPAPPRSPSALVGSPEWEAALRES
ncbi:MAG TPA: arsinothricin resistance N-acetyltransferase ArsN1 family B [Roseiflexaceae bacterium]|nr:arsinothricin resistance N-acetyltransferase ArsN1 family B [Roseiflexaceae bacterium]